MSTGSTTKTAPRSRSAAAPLRQRLAGERLRRFRKDRLATAALGILVLLALGSLFGPMFWRYSYSQVLPLPGIPPSLSHPFGTDAVGHDILAQVMRGTWRSLEIGVTVAVLTTAAGGLLGAVSGYFGGLVDAVIMRIVDLVLIVPAIAVLGLIAARQSGSGTGWLALALTISAFMWAPICRMVRGVCLTLQTADYVQASRGLGAGNTRVVLRHIIPNVTGILLSNLTISLATAILLESAASFVGLGIQPPDTSLGLQVSQGLPAATTRPWLFYIPGAILVLIILCANFAGEGLRKVFDPRSTELEGNL